MTESVDSLISAADSLSDSLARFVRPAIADPDSLPAVSGSEKILESFQLLLAIPRRITPEQWFLVGLGSTITLLITLLLWWIRHRRTRPMVDVRQYDDGSSRCYVSKLKDRSVPVFHIWVKLRHTGGEYAHIDRVLWNNREVKKLVIFKVDPSGPAPDTRIRTAVINKADDVFFQLNFEMPTEQIPSDAAEITGDIKMIGTGGLRCERIPFRIADVRP